MKTKAAANKYSIHHLCSCTEMWWLIVYIYSFFIAKIGNVRQKSSKSVHNFVLKRKWVRIFVCKLKFVRIFVRTRNFSFKNNSAKHLHGPHGRFKDFEPDANLASRTLTLWLHGEMQEISCTAAKTLEKTNTNNTLTTNNIWYRGRVLRAHCCWRRSWGATWGRTPPSPSTTTITTATTPSYPVGFLLIILFLPQPSFFSPLLPLPLYSLSPLLQSSPSCLLPSSLRSTTYNVMHSINIENYCKKNHFNLIYYK